MNMPKESIIAFCFWSLYAPISLVIMYDPTLLRFLGLVNVFMIGILVVAFYLMGSYLWYRHNTVERDMDEENKEEEKIGEQEEAQQNEPSHSFENVFKEDFGKNIGGNSN